MQFIKITKHIFSFVTAAVIIFAFVGVRAEEHGGGGGEEAAPAEHEGKSPGAEAKEGGGGPNNSEFVEYSKRLNKMTQIQSKLTEGTARLKELIKQKNHGSHEIKDEKNNHVNILDSIAQQHKQLSEDYDLFNEELRAITYRFPSKGEEIGRKYIPLRPKTLEQVEREMGLEGDLTALKDKVDAKYKAFAPNEEPTPIPQVPKHESTLKDKNAEKAPRLKLVK